MPKTWLITGSARGLGRSITEAALAAGHNVVATARDPGRLADLQGRYPDTLLSFALDVTDAAAAKAAVDFTVEAFGRLDVLVNNAGFGHIAPFEQTREADFRAQIDTNFYGVVNLTRAALPVMRHQRSGHIINVSSVGGRISMPGLSAYQAAKWAVGGFTEVLAKEAAPFGVKLVSLEPGGMRTDWGEIARGNAPALLPDYEPSVGAVLEPAEELCRPRDRRSRQDRADHPRPRRTRHAAGPPHPRQRRAPHLRAGRSDQAEGCGGVGRGQRFVGFRRDRSGRVAEAAERGSGLSGARIQNADWADQSAGNPLPDGRGHGEGWTVPN